MGSIDLSRACSFLVGGWGPTGRALATRGLRENDCAPGVTAADVWPCICHGHLGSVACRVNLNRIHKVVSNIEYFVIKGGVMVKRTNQLSSCRRGGVGIFDSTTPEFRPLLR